MRKLQIGLIFTVVLLTGCDHHKSTNQAQAESGSAAVAQTDSDLTGQPSSPDKAYPKAKPVALASTPSDNEPAKPEASSTPASDTASTASSAPSSDTTASTPAMAPSSPATDSNSTPSSVSTIPAPSLSEPVKETAQEQVVVLQTSLGRIVIELDDFAAPKTCENFRKLVTNGDYNHTVFHRVIPNFMIQGGDPNSKSTDRASYGQGGPGYTLSPEIKLKHDRGAVAMARLPDSVNPQRESNGSQFYICVAPCPSLDDQYTVFGHVIKGMDVAVNIAEQARDKRDNPLSRIEMEASLTPKDKALDESSAVNP